MKSLILATKLHVKAVFESRQGFVFTSGDSHGRGLIARSVQLDLMFEGVVVKIICVDRQLVNIM
jgi:hypothetical protein